MVRAIEGNKFGIIRRCERLSMNDSNHFKLPQPQRIRMGHELKYGYGLRSLSCIVWNMDTIMTRDLFQNMLKEDLAQDIQIITILWHRKGLYKGPTLTFTSLEFVSL